MGVKVQPWGYPKPTQLTFHCPGCGEDHTIRTPDAKGSGPQWTWNGSLDRPSFEPSIRARSRGMCHFFVHFGRIEFCPDSTHDLRGQTVDLPDWETPVGNETNETKAPEPQPTATAAATPPAEAQPAAPAQSAAPAGPHADLIAEAIAWVKSKGYEAAAAVSIVAEHGFRKILRDKAEETGAPAAKPGTPSTTHAAACGDVGETGKHGDLGTNAIDYKPVPAAETKAKSA